MSLLGIDVGTTGCKAAAFSQEGLLLASAYVEYDNLRPEAGWAELDPVDIWVKIKRVIAQVVSRTPDPVKALAISSLGEAVVPVTKDRQILGPSMLNFDVRGQEYLAHLSEVERTVIRARFALDQAEDDAAEKSKTLEQVGQMIGVTKERVRQIQNKALGKLRVALEHGLLA